MRLLIPALLLVAISAGGWRIWLAYNPLDEDDEPSATRRMVTSTANVLLYVTAAVAVVGVLLLGITFLRSLWETLQ